MIDGQGEKINIHQLAVSQQPPVINQRIVQQAYVVRDELMMFCQHSKTQLFHSINYAQRTRVLRLGQNANATVLRQRAGEPPVSMVAVEPIGRTRVMWVHCVKQSHEDVYIQQRRNDLKPHRFPDSVDHLVGNYIAGGR